MGCLINAAGVLTLDALPMHDGQVLGGADGGEAVQGGIPSLERYCIRSAGYALDLRLVVWTRVRMVQAVEFGASLDQLPLAVFVFDAGIGAAGYAAKAEKHKTRCKPKGCSDQCHGEGGHAHAP